MDLGNERKRKSKYSARNSSNETAFVTGQLPPQAVELEESVLGAIMIEGNIYSDICTLLSPDSFYSQKNATIYKSIATLATKQEPIDIITVRAQLQKDGVLEEIGGATELARLAKNVINTIHAYEHAKIIAEKSTARRLITYASAIQKDAYSEEIDIDDLVQQAEGKLFEITQKNITQDYVRIDGVLEEAVHMIEVAKQNEGVGGVPSGFTRLDAMTNGWQKSDLVIIAARPAMGKTAFVLSMARNIAEAGHGVAVFSLEMSKVQLVNRLLVNVTELSSEQIKKGNLSDNEMKRVMQGVKMLEDKPIFLDDTPSLSVFEFSTKARRLVASEKVEIIIIDYLQLMNASGMNFGSREQEVSMISRSLKQLAKELNIPIIALSQLNRGVENRDKNDKRPQLADLRESGAIEQDADMVLFIHRPEYYKMELMSDGQDAHGKAEIIIAKHRNGATGDVILRFIGSQTKFCDLDASDQAASPQYNETQFNPQSQGYADGSDTANAFAPQAMPAAPEIMNPSAVEAAF